MTLVGSFAIVLSLLMFSWDFVLDRIVNHHIHSEIVCLECAHNLEEEAANAGSRASLGAPVAARDGFPVLLPRSWKRVEARMKASAKTYRARAAYHAAQVEVYMAMKRRHP